MECLIILISLCLVWVAEKQRQLIEAQRKRTNDWSFKLHEALDIRMSGWKRESRRILGDAIERRFGELDSAIQRAAIAEKLAERSFNIASSATLGVIALQKTLAVPRIASKPMLQRNLLAKNEIDKLFTTEGSYDFLRSELSEEELEVLDKLEEQKLKDGSN